MTYAGYKAHVYIVHDLILFFTQKHLHTLSVANLTTCTILALFSPHAEPAPHLLLPLLDHLYHQPLFQICITSPVESTPFFIPSTSLCSLSSRFTSSYVYHLITVTTFALTIYHSLHLSLQT